MAKIHYAWQKSLVDAPLFDRGAYKTSQILFFAKTFRSIIEIFIETGDKMFQGLFFQIPFTSMKCMKGKTSINILT